MPGGKDVDLGINISARDLASGPIGLISGSFRGLQNAMAAGMPQILGGFAAMGAGIASISAGAAAFKTAWNFATFAGEFDTEMAAVRTISRATESQFNDLSEAATEAGIQTQFAPAQAAGGLRVLSQQGLIAKDSIEALVPVLDFAAAGNLDVAEAAEVAMGTMNAYGMTVDQMTNVTDKLMRGTQMSALSANEFITVMGRAASSGKVFGTNLDDVIIGLGSMRSAGIPATVATTAMGEAMRRLTTDAKAAEVLKEYGVQTEDSAGKLRSVIDLTRDFQLAIEGETEARQAQLVSQVFGIRGMRQFSAIANIMARKELPDGTVQTLRGAEAIAHYRQQLEDAGGTTERFRRDRLATFAGQMVLLQGTIETFKTVFGHAFGIIFRPLMFAVTEAVNFFVRAWRSLGENSQVVIGIFGLVAAGLAIGLGALLTFGGALTVIIVLFGKALAIAAVVGMGIAAALAPVVVAIGGLIAVGVALWKAYQSNLGGLGDFINGWVSKIRLAFTALKQIFTQGFFSEAVTEQLGMAENEGIRPFVMAIRDLWVRVQMIGQGFMETWSQLWNSLGPVFEELKNAFSSLMSQISEAFGGLIGGANAMPYDKFESFGSMLATVVGTGLRWVIQGITFLIRAGLGLYKVLSPIIGIVRVVHRVFWDFATKVLWPVLKVVWELVKVFMKLQEYLSPGSWVMKGIQWLGGGGEEGQPGATLAEGQRARAEETRVGILSDAARRSDDRRGTEPSFERPAATDRAVQAGSIDELASLMGQGTGGAPRTQRVENQVTLQLDRRQLASVIQELGIDSDTANGSVITDEFGYQQSVPG